MNHPNRSKQRQEKPINPYVEGFKAGRKDGEEIRAELLAALDNIVTNAKLIPDPAMEGTTDTYSVPLDDIEAARAILAKAYRR